MPLSTAKCNDSARMVASRKQASRKSVRGKPRSSARCSLVKRGGSADTARQARTIVRTGPPGIHPGFAVALNCGTGSSSLNAEVNAFERLQIVRGRNSSYFGSK